MVKRDMFYFADIDEKFIDITKIVEGLEDGVLVHCEQCTEKNLKAIIQKKYGIVLEDNNLVKLLEMLYLQDYPQLKRYKNLCRALKDFYFSRRYASNDYEVLTHDEYTEYIDEFYLLLDEIKNIRNELE